MIFWGPVAVTPRAVMTAGAGIIVASAVLKIAGPSPYMFGVIGGSALVVFGTGLETGDIRMMKNEDLSKRFDRGTVEKLIGASSLFKTNTFVPFNLNGHSNF